MLKKAYYHNIHIYIKKSIEFFVKMFKEIYGKKFNWDWKKLNYHNMRNLEVLAMMLNADIH